ncbi:hypothetical protein [Synechococcus sp. PCC 6312]|uniref:hypothetical protein n=1 Tax=Synechococcus sp. (strain ATCC 27167 / PCC 6312) TaxID=195253 RepID=UPI00029ED51D|nr:hypothetical protein [Synechococcus sp. PCC 6312]AFY59923.1 hypothetical protein Syn6312_0703 [Synechococcus sp. PCC 6312]
MNDLSTAIATLSLMSVAIASINLYGYWQPFGINPIPYLSFQQLVAYSVVPLFDLTVIGSLLILGLNLSLFYSPNAIRKRETEPESYELSRSLIFGFVLITSIILTIIRGVRGDTGWWYFLVILIFLGYIHFSDRGIFTPLPFKNQFQALLVIFAFIVLFQGYISGSADANKLLDLSSPSNATLIVEKKIEEVKLIGKLDNMYYILDKDISVIAIPEKEVSRVKYKSGLRIRP